jgi:SAM-dependent methyltransferase
MELLLGCGASRERRMPLGGRAEWRDLVTLDHNPDHMPDVVFDLDTLAQGVPLPFADDTFDELAAYEVLEHIGAMGDWRAFFAQFSEFWRVLKPGGYLAATCPSYRSMWAFGDPSHTRVLTSGHLVFLDQDQYVQQVDRTATGMSDFRFVWRGDFEVARGPDGRALIIEDDADLRFVVRAVKPSRWVSPNQR